MFKTYYREPFTRVKLTRAINEFKARGLYRRPWNLLDLRHSYGVNFLAQGGSLRDLQAIMGHAQHLRHKTPLRRACEVKTSAHS